MHLRDGAALASVAKFTAERFGRAIVMPNLKPPVVSVDQAAAYRERILDALPDGIRFEPLMTLYLTDATAPGEIDRAVGSAIVHGVKLYPAGATTHSEAGVTDIGKTYAVLERMQRLGLPLLVHGETTRPEVDVFDRETVLHRRIAGAAGGAIPRAQGRVRAHHHGARRRVRRCCPAGGRRDDHAAASPAQSQRDIFRRHPPAFLLPADSQA